MNNTLLDNFKTAYESAPFSSIQNEYFIPAFEAAIKEAKLEIDQIVSNKEEASFENTLVPLEFSGNKLNRISSIFFNLNAAETNEEIQGIAQKISPMLSEFANDIRLNVALFKKIETVYQNSHQFNLNSEQKMLLEKNYKAFIRNGSNLNEKDKKVLRDIDMNKSKLGLNFGENVLAETNDYELVLTDKNDLAGLPDGVVEAAKMLADEKQIEGWIFTLDYPSYIPFMTYADNRKLREKLAKDFGSRAMKNNEHDNQQNIIDIVNLRHQRANLLGYKSHAHYVLEERMAEEPDNVKDFLEKLLSKAKPAAEKEFQLLKDLAKKDGIDNIEKWDGAYYSEKLKKALFALDDEQLKPYFKLENVIQGVFDISGKLYDLHFEAITDIDTYHEDVKTYKVTNSDGDFVSLFYADFFPRKGKRNGAWMTSYKAQWKTDKVNSRPHVSFFFF